MQNAVDTININPFPGLRPFSTNESHLFFGREGQSETILSYLSKYKFAAVTGASGSGKSSLIYSGVVPLLYGGFIKEAGSKWEVITSRPGNSPKWNLAQSFAKLEQHTRKDSKATGLAEYYFSLMNRNSSGLSEAVKQLKLSPETNLLIVIDQFEELFRYKEGASAQSNQADNQEAFINLLVNVASKVKLPVYIILTMRSDFISHCSENQGLTALINKSNYLVPQMTRSDFENVICGPLRVAGVDLETKLLQHILNSLGEHHDQLPVLQHALMRTWEFWKKNNDAGSAIGMRDYQAAGKHENSLSLHANEAYNELSDANKHLCKIIFKALTEKGKEGKGIRRPLSVLEISALAQVQPARVIKVVEVFRKPGRSFITPYSPLEIIEETIIDISHESLMRIWDKLNFWVDEEASSAQMYKRLVELSDLYQRGKTSLMHPPDLHLATNWKKAQKPNRTWALRYNPAFEKAMVYLNTSEKKYQAEEGSKVKLQKRELHRSRRLAVVMSAFAVVLLMAMFYAYFQREDAIEQKEKAEVYAKILEAQKDTAVELSQTRAYELMAERQLIDSLNRYQQFQTFQSEEERVNYQQQLDELSKQAEELERIASLERAEREQAQNKAQLAILDRSKSEEERRAEKRLRLQALSQTVALKAMQADNAQVSGLLAYHAFLLNRENGGQNNHPEIYRGLYYALQELKGDRFNTLAGHTAKVNDMVFDPARNILYSADESGIINSWGFRKSNPKASAVTTNEDANTCLAITADGRWMACGSEVRTVQLFNALQPSQAPRIFDAHNGRVNRVRFIPGRNAMVTSGSDNRVKYWDLLTNEGKLIYENTDGLNDVDVNPNGKDIIIAAANNQLLRWSVGAATPIVIYRHSQPIISVSYDHEGEHIALGDRAGKIVIFNTRNNQIVKIIKAHASRVLSLAYSPNNRQLASSGLDGVIRIWNTTNWNNLPIEIREHQSWAESITFSPDGKSLLSTGNGRNLIYQWPVKTSHLVDELCQYISRQLTSEEWSLYLGTDINYREVCN